MLIPCEMLISFYQPRFIGLVIGNPRSTKPILNSWSSAAMRRRREQVTQVSARSTPYVREVRPGEVMELRSQLISMHRQFGVI